MFAMQSMGIGGGMLMNIYSQREQRAYSVLSREVAPLAVEAKLFEKFKNVSQLLQSSLAIAVPTELMGYAAAHERFGNLAWAELVKPTIGICHKGYMLTKHQRDALLTNKVMILKDNLLSRMFVDPLTADFYKAGSYIKPPVELCRTYELLAENGPRSFYQGQLGAEILADLRDMHSIIDERDFRALKIQLVPSLALPFENYTLHLTPPPGSSYIVAYIMNILRKFSLQFRQTRAMDALATHRIVEALKFGFAKRWLLDSDINEQLIELITCPHYAELKSNHIDDTQTHDNLAHYGADVNLLAQEQHGTAHIAVLAPNGDAVSVTSSINFYFGSGRTGKRTGILFNNAMSDFSIANMSNYFDLPNVKAVNHIRPGRSPMSSMAPIIVTDHTGTVRLVVGAAGGSKIISVLIQILVRTLWLHENIKQAIDAARFHHQLLPNVFEYEYGILQKVIESLEAKRHHTHRYRERGSAVCGIERIENIIFANADYRKDGAVAGF